MVLSGWESNAGDDRYARTGCWAITSSATSRMQRASELEMKQGSKFSKHTPVVCSTFSSKDLPQTLSPTEDDVFKYLSLWRLQFSCKLPQMGPHGIKSCGHMEMDFRKQPVPSLHQKPNNYSGKGEENLFPNPRNEIWVGLPCLAINKIQSHRK